MSVFFRAFVKGDPKGQPRGRAFAAGGKPRIYTPGTAEAWKGEIARAFESQLPPAPIAEPVELFVTFYFKRPQRLRRKKDPEDTLPHTNKPDWDNLGKAVSDALVQIGLLDDDRWIVRAVVAKFYVTKTPGIQSSPGAFIEVRGAR